MSKEQLETTYMGRPNYLPVTRRIGDWALVKHMYGYDLYHAPAGLEPKSLPAKAIDPSLVMGRTYLGYRPGLSALKDVAEAFSDFDRSIEQLRDIKTFLEQRL